MRLLESHAGYWSLIVILLEVPILLGLLWKRTGTTFFRTWSRRSTLVLPPALYLTYLFRPISLDPRTIRTLEDYNLFMTRLLIRDSEILAARSIPAVSVAIVLLALWPAFWGFLERSISRKLGA